MANIVKTKNHFHFTVIIYVLCTYFIYIYIAYLLTL
jgi:hypothetical protein